MTSYFPNCISLSEFNQPYEMGSHLDPTKRFVSCNLTAPFSLHRAQYPQPALPLEIICQWFSGFSLAGHTICSRILLGKSVLWSDIPYQILLSIKSESITAQHKMLKSLFPGHEMCVWTWGVTMGHSELWKKKKQTFPSCCLWHLKTKLLCQQWQHSNVQPLVYQCSCPSNW